MFFSLSLSPFEPGNLVSQDRFGRSVSRQPAHCPHSGWIWCLLTGFLPLPTTASICLCRQPPSGQSRVYQVTQLRTDGIRCRESTGTGPVVLKVVLVTDAAFSGTTTDQFVCASLVPHPLLVYWYSRHVQYRKQSEIEEALCLGYCYNFS